MNYIYYDNRKDKKNDKARYIKLWVWAILFVSIVFIIIQLLYNNFVYNQYDCTYETDGTSDLSYTKSVTPNYPTVGRYYSSGKSCLTYPQNVPRPLLHFE